MAKHLKKKFSELATADAVQLSDPALLTDIRQLVEAARQQTARAVNSALVGMYWQIGRRIREDVLSNERAEYGRKLCRRCLHN